MNLYILSYTKNMEFRGNIVEFDKIKETIDRLKQYDITVSYITKIAEDDQEVKKLLGIYKRTKKINLRHKYINEIENMSIILGNKPISADSFLNGL